MHAATLYTNRKVVGKAHHSGAGDVFEVFWMIRFVDPEHHFKVVVTEADAATGAAAPAQGGARWGVGNGNFFLRHDSPDHGRLYALISSAQPYLKLLSRVHCVCYESRDHPERTLTLGFAGTWSVQHIK